jgi:NADH dehydrogenase/NADH:ubiquinone oxidoreductase subunit G
MVSVDINNVKIEVQEGTTILSAAVKAGVKIPTLCHVEGKTPRGACRVCVVEVEGAKTLVASCCTPVTDKMKIFTNTKRARQARRNVVELLLSEHDGDCKTCERNDNCELQELARNWA